MRSFKIASYKRIVFMLLLWSMGVPGSTSAQQDTAELSQRLTRLEADVEAIEQSLIELTDNFNQSIQEYTQGLGQSLDSYSQKLQENIDERLNEMDRQRVILNPYSKSYQTIESNTGTFLIAVDRVEKIDNGFRLYLNIGNPNFADYQNFNLKILWGSGWAGSQVMSYQEWRNQLQGAEFSFEGRLEKGLWNSTAVDLIAEENINLDYVECELSVSGIELGYQ